MQKTTTKKGSNKSVVFPRESVKECVLADCSVNINRTRTEEDRKRILGVPDYTAKDQINTGL
jgi:hypothetical protein